MTPLFLNPQDPAPDAISLSALQVSDAQTRIRCVISSADVSILGRFVFVPAWSLLQTHVEKQTYLEIRGDLLTVLPSTLPTALSEYLSVPSLKGCLCFLSCIHPILIASPVASRPFCVRSRFSAFRLEYCACTKTAENKFWKC